MPQIVQGLSVWKGMIKAQVREIMECQCQNEISMCLQIVNVQE
jgi:hypothetical protein